MAIEVRLLATQLPATHLHSQQPVPPLVGQGRSEADGAQHPLPPPAAAAAPHTREGFFPWAATQTASEALH